MTSRNKAEAARLLGVDRVTLYRKIKRYNLTEDTPDEVLHVTQRSCNAYVACNTVFSCRIGPEHCPLSRKLLL
ncbi:MAG: helix-turn-helix domain-containing protein [Syntrophobacteraceae bacterium]